MVGVCICNDTCATQQCLGGFWNCTLQDLEAVGYRELNLGNAAMLSPRSAPEISNEPASA